MPSVSAGKYRIKTIKVYKDHVTLSFLKREKLQISKEAYLSSYLYEGKSISNKEIEKLEEITASSKLLNYALSLVNKRRYSERKMYDKLKAKEEDKKAIWAVINKLKSNGLLDDEAYMLDLIKWDDQRKFGKSKIIKHLKDQGIPDNIISKAKFSSSNELKKAKVLLPKLDKKYSRYAYESKKKHIYQAYLSQGFNHDIAREVVNDLKKQNNKVEQDLLKKDYEKIKNRYEKKYEGYQLKQKIYAALINKGYKYQEIRKILEDFTYEDDSGF